MDLLATFTIGNSDHSASNYRSCKGSSEQVDILHSFIIIAV